MLLRRWSLWLVVGGLLLVVGLFLSVEGQVVLLRGNSSTLAAPRFQLEPPAPQPGEQVVATVFDTDPWAFVLLTVDGAPAHPLGSERAGTEGWFWRWSFVAPLEPGYELAFYRDCHTGCIERGRVAVGSAPRRVARPARPTKLGVVFPHPEREWHGRMGWVVELTYVRQAEEVYWSVDDLAERVARHSEQGLRVLVRVDYDQGQSIPPADDHLALDAYLEYLRRLARDDRLGKVYGYIIGTGFNARGSNLLAPDHPVTPAWYARVFNGYGEDPTHGDNAVQVIHGANPRARVIVGPVRAWNTDQDGDLPYTIDVPWLNYMHTLVAYLDAGTQAKTEAGFPLVRADGFDVQAPGRPDAPELGGVLRADEPRQSLPRVAWGGAQAGFRIYEEWLEIINGYPTTQGLPVYIISTNTYDREADIPPAQNYPRGWLTTALEVVDAEPQIHALCWFLDYFPYDTQWERFSLSGQTGRMVDAATEFDALLRGEGRE